MLTASREMTSKEKRKLRELVGWIRQNWVWAGMVLFLLYVAALAISGTLVRLLISLLATRLQFPHQRLLYLSATAFLMVLFHLWLRRRWWASPWSRQLKADLAGEMAVIHVVEVADSLLVQEVEDEGPTVFVKTSDLETLVFAGQYLGIYTARGFPWTRFEIVEGPTSQFFLGLKRLAPTRKAHIVPGPLPWPMVKKYIDFKRSWSRIDVPFEQIRCELAQGGTAP